MRRWHSPRERVIMLRRWRQEIAKHEERAQCSLAPLPPNAAGDCHCYRGAGFMRKRRPFGCSRPRCGLCHFAKLDEPKDRYNNRRYAIFYELAAERTLEPKLRSSLPSSPRAEALPGTAPDTARE